MTPEKMTPYRGPPHHHQRHPKQKQFSPIKKNIPGSQAGRPTTSTLGTKSTRPKTRCWTCGEPHYQRYCPVEKARVNGSIGHTIVGYLGKVHKIHAAVNNHQVENHSTVIETSGTITDQNFIILIDLGATKRFISSAVLKGIKVREVEQDKFRYVEIASGSKKKVGGRDYELSH
jgi:hypothetical protein